MVRGKRSMDAYHQTFARACDEDRSLDVANAWNDEIDSKAESLLEQMRGTVGGLSDLRYGRLANGQLREQVLEGLSRLESSCGK